MESEPKMVDHVVTQEDLDAGLYPESKVGDVVQVPEESNDDSDDTQDDNEDQPKEETAE